MNDDANPGPSTAERPQAPADTAGSSTAPTTTPRPPLLRSTDDRLVAGVCGGLGEHFGVDPVVFRIVLTVLSLFGGVGVLVYGLGWLLITARDEERPVLRRVLAGKFDSGAAAATVVAVMGVTLFFTYLDAGFGPSVPLLMITCLVLAMVWSDTKKRNVAAQRAGAAAMTAPTPTPVPSGAGPASGAGDTPPSWWRVPGGDAPAAGPVAPRVKSRTPRPRSYVALATVSIVTIIGGVLWVLDHTGAVDVTLAVALAVLLGVLGLGLLAGAFVGRARVLVLPAAVLTVLLVGVTAITVPLTGPAGERSYAPMTASAVPASYELGMGAMDIDLRRLDVGPGGRAAVRARVGAGQIRVWVPADVTVVFTGRVDVGEIRTPDGRDDGYRPTRIRTLAPRTGSPGPGRATITLDLRVGVGQVEVLYGDSGQEQPR